MNYDRRLVEAYLNEENKNEKGSKVGGGLLHYYVLTAAVIIIIIASVI